LVRIPLEYVHFLHYSTFTGLPSTGWPELSSSSV
jgi:hypothetical protein